MGKRYRTFLIVLIMLPFLSVPKYSTTHTSIRVVDFFTKNPIQGAIITFNNNVFLTDENGMLSTDALIDKVYVRAHGYLRAEKTIEKSLLKKPVQVELVPFTPKALYLSFYGIGSKALRDPVLKLIEETELNALVIDVKGDRGGIMYKSSVPLATEIGAQKIITVKDIKSVITSLKEKGIYLIARIVVFKDDLLAHARPELAIRTQDGQIWYDRENLAWVDPSRKEVWDYVINIAIEAAQQGFDEIQFDYVRFPDTTGLVFSVPNTSENRINAISGFVAEAKRRLIPYNVFLSADIFGYVCWNQSDTNIGQTLDGISSSVDYLSPMLYPSGFQYGIPGYRNPVAYSYEMVFFTLKKAQLRTNLPSTRFRPWLQAFRDYAFDKRHFTAKEIREQIEAAEKFGAHGWMLWNPLNVYSDEGLKKTGS